VGLVDFFAISEVLADLLWTAYPDSAPWTLGCQPFCRLLGTIHQVIPAAPQSRLKPGQRRHQDVQSAGLDLLDGPGIDADQFGQCFLGKLTGNAQPANIASHRSKEG
jgi:hypothetical protein